jgi:hypothetical protein
MPGRDPLAGAAEFNPAANSPLRGNQPSHISLKRPRRTGRHPHPEPQPTTRDTSQTTPAHLTNHLPYQRVGAACARNWPRPHTADATDPPVTSDDSQCPESLPDWRRRLRRLRALGPRVREVADKHLIVLYFEYLDLGEPKFPVESVAMYLPVNPADARVARLAIALLPETNGVDEYFVERLHKLAGS